jgi:hypothetical protein
MLNNEHPRRRQSRQTRIRIARSGSDSDFNKNDAVPRGSGNAASLFNVYSKGIYCGYVEILIYLNFKFTIVCIKVGC